jgi:hypothetical protein
MCPIRSMILPLRNAPSVKPPKKALSTRPDASKFSIATRNEINVPKKPLASCTTLVAMTSIPICVRIDPLSGIEVFLVDRVQHRDGCAVNDVAL